MLCVFINYVWVCVCWNIWIIYLYLLLFLFTLKDFALIVFVLFMTNNYLFFKNWHTEVASLLKFKKHIDSCFQLNAFWIHLITLKHITFICSLFFIVGPNTVFNQILYLQCYFFIKLSSMILDRPLPFKHSIIKKIFKTDQSQKKKNNLTCKLFLFMAFILLN